VSGERYAFGAFVLEPADRRLRDAAGAPVEIGARYFDALLLLVRADGALVSKDRFMDEVWRGVPVTDEALTQCVRALRKALDDEASAPRYIETVPRHGYRFVAPVERVEGSDSVRAAAARVALPRDIAGALLLGAAGAIGGGVAGVFGGLFYGLGATSAPFGAGIGAISMLLVLLCLNIAIAAAGGAAVGLGIAGGELVSARGWASRVAGGALGGVLVGGAAHLLGLDAFALLFGSSPQGMTGAAEGGALGAAVGLGAWFAERSDAARPLIRRLTPAALIGALTGVAVPLLGGRLMGGSLALLAETFPASRLRLDRFGAVLGERGFGLAPQVLTGGVEGLVFATCLVGALLLARRDLSRPG
jgi:DNA-binding winged helix-turn-helix (wHTH) protein